MGMSQSSDGTHNCSSVVVLKFSMILLEKTLHLHHALGLQLSMPFPKEPQSTAEMAICFFQSCYLLFHKGLGSDHRKFHKCLGQNYYLLSPACQPSGTFNQFPITLRSGVEWGAQIIRTRERVWLWDTAVWAGFKHIFSLTLRTQTLQTFMEESRSKHSLVTDTRKLTRQSCSPSLYT